MLFKPPVILREAALAQSPSKMLTQKIIPSWNTAGRPKEPKTGTFGFNFQTKYLEYWNGVRWMRLRMKKIE